MTIIKPVLEKLNSLNIGRKFRNERDDGDNAQE